MLFLTISSNFQQFSQSHLVSFALVGKTSMRNLSLPKKSESLVKIASESSSRQQLSSNVPFFLFDSTLLVGNEKGVMKLVRSESRKNQVDLKMDRKVSRVPKNFRMGQSQRRLKMLLPIKTLTPRSVGKTSAKLGNRYHEIRKTNPYELSLSDALQSQLSMN